MNLNVIWAWIKAQGPALLVVERVVLTVAGLSGLLAFWQYWDEREGRAVEHLSATLNTYLACQELVRFSLTQESDIAHQYLTFIVDYEDARAVCQTTINELNQLLRETGDVPLPTAEEAREMLERAVPQNAPDF